ncbi:MAG: HAMP domain-containing sensor histidine kinase, partial [Candidatus Eremiobacterota bacterium]
MLTVHYTGLLTLGLLLLGSGVYHLVERHLIVSGEFRLFRLVADGLRDELGKGDWRRGELLPAPPGLPEGALPLALGMAEPRSFVRMYGPDGALWCQVDPRRNTASPTEEATRGLVALHGDRRTFFLRAGGLRWQVLSVALYDRDRVQAVVVAGLPWDYSQDLLDSLAVYFALVGLAAVLLTVLVSRWLASRLTRPLERLARAAARVAAGDLKARVGQPPGNREEARLTRAFDTMVERLEMATLTQKRFVADASHELKTPLTALGGMIEMLGRGAYDKLEDRTVALAAMEREVDRMGRLVGDLLALSRAELRRSAPQQLELLPMLEEACHLGPLNHQLSIDCPASLRVNADPESLESILRNLVNNAVKFTPAGRAIRVRAAPQGSQVEIRIEDEGIGIAAE